MDDIIEKEWLSFKSYLVDALPKEEASIRATFYGGALSAFTAIMKSEDRRSDIPSMQRELAAFQREIYEQANTIDETH